MNKFDDDFPITMEVECDPVTGQQRQNCPPVGVSFGLNPLQDSQKSLEAGHPVYIDVEFVKIAIPGDKTSLFLQPSTEQHRKRFPNAYRAFKERGKVPIEGQPIEEWAPITRSMALTFKAANIPTVEALAGVHDGFIDRLGYAAREMREKAKAHLAQARDTAAASKDAAEKEALKVQLAALQAQITALTTANATAAPPADDAAAAARRPRAAARG